MKILFINTYDTDGGAAIAAYRLYRAVKKIGIEADFFCMHKKSDDDKVVTVDSFIKRAAYRTAFYIERKLLYRRYNSNLNISKWSFNIVPNFIMPPIENGYDLVHMHWIGDSFISMRALQKIKIPIIWTLHDSWAFTGGCHLPYDCRGYLKNCGHCPQLKSGTKNDLSLAIYNSKLGCYSNLKNLKIITPSNWLAGLAKKSSLFFDKDIKVIGNGVDGEIFKPANKNEVRSRLGLDAGKKLIMFSGIAAINNINKGFHFLIASLKLLYNRFDDIELVVAGDYMPEKTFDFKYKINYIGKITDEKIIALYNAAVDVVAVPSMSENLPNTIIEAFASGTPAVAFNVGGISDIIDNKINGCLVKPYDVKEFAEAIAWTLGGNDIKQKLYLNARHKFLEKFDINRVANLYKESYITTIAMGKNDLTKYE